MSAKSVFTVALLAVLAVGRRADAFEVKHAATGAVVHWHTSNVTWTVDRSVLEVDGAERALVDAANAWSRREGAPDLVVKSGVDRVSPGLDGTNALIYAEGGFEPAGKALAVTILSFDEDSGEVLDADIVLNGKYQFAALDPAMVQKLKAENDASAEIYDVGRVLGHEMGHGLALSDEPTLTTALMYPYVPHAQILPATPAADDLKGLDVLYGAAEISAPTGGAGSPSGCGATVARSASVPAGACVGAGLVLVAWIMARGRRRGRHLVASCSVVAAAALVAPVSFGPRETPSRSAVFEAKVVVTAATTRVQAGLFRTEIDVAPTTCATQACPSRRIAMWGGSLGGVRQVIGGTVVPSPGDVVAMDAIGL